MPLNDKHACFMGLDSSTQSLKALIVDRNLQHLCAVTVDFDRELPEFKTVNGVHRHPDGMTVTAPPLMWVAALELALEKLRSSGAPLDRVAAISGAGQQHGSVWLRAGAAAVMKRLDPAHPLREQLADIFSLPHAPVWMDSSTAVQCAALEQSLGGAQSLADLTGSRAYERFTGNQIARVFAENRPAYDSTERIALVSSFMASILAGLYAPIDFSDGSGMNLLDIRTRCWAPAALAAVGDKRLSQMLGEPAPAYDIAGALHPFYIRRYGFNPRCMVTVFTGDNPASLAGLRLQNPGAAALSLGTSDTLFGTTDNPAPSGKEGHVFVSPVHPGGYMVMLVRKNGSLMREQIRDICAAGDWQKFNAALAAVPPGNNGQLGFYHAAPEITPPSTSAGIWRYDAQSRSVKEFPPEVECRAVVESQFLCLYLHAANIGLKPDSLLVTGGASVNCAIIQIAADVFGVTAHTADQPDSAALGAAYRACHAWACAQSGRFISFDEIVGGAPPSATLVKPCPDAHRIYRDLLPRYADLENKLFA